MSTWSLAPALRAILLGFALSPGLAAAQTSSATPVLWYRQPARIWNDALPVGNGRLGAMVYGGAADEHLQLNEETLTGRHWAGLALALTGLVLLAKK